MSLSVLVRGGRQNFGDDGVVIGVSLSTCVEHDVINGLIGNAIHYFDLTLVAQHYCFHDAIFRSADKSIQRAVDGIVFTRFRLAFLFSW